MTTSGNANPGFHRCELDCGIVSLSESIPGSRSIAFGVWVHAGSRDEPDDINGISHFIEHMTYKGTASRSAKEIAYEIDLLGGHFDAFTSRENTVYFFQVLDEHIFKSLDLLKDMLCSSSYDTVELEKERMVIIEEIRSIEDTPDDLVGELLSRMIWDSHPLGNPIAGSYETVNKLYRDNVRAYARSKYNSDNIVFSMAGNVNHSEINEWLERNFCIAKGVAEKKTAKPPQFHSGVTGREKDLEQVHISIGLESLNLSSPERYNMYVLNGILGGSVASRLFQQVREEQGLAYSVFSANVGFIDSGYLLLYAAAQPKNIPPMLDTVRSILRSLATSGVTDDELARIKSQTKANLIMSLESASSRMMNLARKEIYLGCHESIDEILENVNNVTASEIQNLAHRLFSGKKAALSFVGPVDYRDFSDWSL